MHNQLDLRAGGSVRFFAREGLMGGRWFALHDVAMVAGRIRRVPLESRSATHRVFVQADGGRWTYAFTVSDQRALLVPDLERQLQAAQYTNAGGHGQRSAMNTGGVR